MKKLATLLVALVASVSTFAQVEKGTFSIKPMVGLDASTITNTYDTDYKLGFTGGVEFGYQLSNRVGLSVGALYAMQGLEGKKSNNDKTFNIHSLNIPVLANVYLWKGLAVKAGVQPEILLAGKMSTNAGDIDMKPMMNSVNLSIPVGVSYDFDCGLSLDARYNIGVTNIFNDKAVMNGYRASSGKSEMFMLTVGYKFKL